MSAAKIASLVITLASISTQSLAAGVFQIPVVEQLADKSAVIEQLETHPTMGGINPDYFAWVVKGRVELGFNRCDAAGRKAEIKSKKVGEDLVVYAQVKTSGDEAGRVCSLQYEPVYAELETVVRGARSETGMIMILNVDRKGSHDAFNP